mmetsp:Transcript_20516/g.51232  ORF Transcript_20516/g.51232 Transcript_20516/m.51232 type:complete len:107 (-) Transcript_20516:689-1009(-)
METTNCARSCWRRSLIHRDILTKALCASTTPSQASDNSNTPQVIRFLRTSGISLRAQCAQYYDNLLWRQPVKAKILSVTAPLARADAESLHVSDCGASRLGRACGV